MIKLFFSFLSLVVSIYGYADELKIHVIKPMYKIDWSSPSSLGLTSGLNTIRKDYAPIGHFAVELNCSNSNSFGIKQVLTGMERISKEESKRITLSKKLGLGSMTYPFKGQLVNYGQSLREIELARNEHRLKTITVPISSHSCEEGLNFIDKWIHHRSYSIYGGNMNALEGEGAGCSDFAMSIFSIVTGIEPPSAWFASVKIPSRLMGDGESKKVEFSDVLTSFSWAKKEEPGIKYKIVDGNKVHEWLGEITTSNEYYFTKHLFPNGVMLPPEVDFNNFAAESAKNYYSSYYVKGFTYQYSDSNSSTQNIWQSIKKK
jgi:hypothetical protein